MARDDAAPMSDARLDQIQASVRFFDYGENTAEIDAIHDLLAEVERLRAREADLLRIIADHQERSQQKVSGGDGA